jgi:hypothetical protein
MELRNPDGVVLAEPIGGSHHPPAVQAAGRVCRAPHCHTILSVYNMSSRCSLHTQPDWLGTVYRVHRTAGTRRTAAVGRGAR